MARIAALIILALTAACQYKAEEDTAGLIAGHQTVENEFTVLTPTSGIYSSGETITYTLRFPFNVDVDTIGGTPHLVLNVGGTTRYADYASGDGGKLLTFTHTVVVADNDVNGVGIASLALNGGIMTFTTGAGVLTNCDVSTVSATSHTGVIVDNAVPTVSSISLTSPSGYYVSGDTLTFLVTFVEAVTVSGTPTIALGGLTTGTATASYVSGSGTTALQFTYSVTGNIRDTNGFTVAAAIVLPGAATITDDAGLSATLTLPALVGSAANVLTLSSVDVNGRVPYVTALTLPANGTYTSAQNLDITLHFSQVVDVTTNSSGPRLALDIGGTTRYATYLSGDLSNALVFRYTTVPGDSGTVTVPSIVNFPGTSDIDSTVAPAGYSYNEDAGLNIYTVPTNSIIVNAPQPTITSVTINPDTTNAVDTAAVDEVWNIGQVMEIVVGFNDNVFVNQTSGTPRIPITLTSGTVYATYYSGGDGQTNLIFRYTVTESDLDADGIAFAASVDLNGGTITNAANTNAILTLTTTAFASEVDGVRPTVFSVTPPANATYSTANVLPSFTTTWSEAVNYTGVVNLPLIIGVTTRNAATVVSGNNTTALVVSYTLVAGDTDADGIAINSPLTGAGSVRDLPGNTATTLTFAPPATPGILVDTTAPSITSVTPPANATYELGENLDFTVNYDESVTVVTTGGTPRLQLTIGAATLYATYTSGSPGTALLFRYTVADGDVDTNGIAVNTTLQTNGGTIRDAGLNNAGTSTGAINTAAVLVDAQDPTVSSVTGPAAGTRYPGDTITLTVNFSESVTVTGNPTIAVTAMNGALSFSCASGTGASTTCSYTVLAGDYDYDGVASATTLVGGVSIEDAVGNAMTNFTFTAPTLTQVRISHDGLLMWGDVSDSNNRSTIGAILTGLTDKSGDGANMSTVGSPTFAGSLLSYDATDDALTFGATLTNARHVFIAVRTASLPFNPALQEIFGDAGMLVRLEDDTADVDLGFGVNSQYSLDCGGLSGVGTSFDETIAGGSSTIVLRTSFTGNQTVAGGHVGNTTFDGSIAEVMVFDNTPSAGDLTNICSYLNTKH